MTCQPGVKAAFGLGKLHLETFSGDGCSRFISGPLRHFRSWKKGPLAFCGVHSIHKIT